MDSKKDTDQFEPCRDVERELLVLDSGKIATIEHLIHDSTDPTTMFDKWGNGFGKWGNGFSKMSF